MRLAAILSVIVRVLWSLLRGRRPRIDAGMAREVRAARHDAARGSASALNRRLADLEARRQAARHAQ